jgi:hypothetical protein
MNHRWREMTRGLILGLVLSTFVIAQSAPTVQKQKPQGPYARIGFFRALDGHWLDMEAGYVRHLNWHRRVKDPSAWYGYAVSSSTEREAWILYATFGHSAAELGSPVAPAEDWSDALTTLFPHAKLMEEGFYEFLPALSHGDGVPTPTLCAEYTTVELNRGASKAFEALIAGEKSKLRGETLWYRLVVGGNTPRYVRLRPRSGLAQILDERADQALPDKAVESISTIKTEVLKLRPDFLVNVTPEAAH